LYHLAAKGLQYASRHCGLFGAYLGRLLPVRSSFVPSYERALPHLLRLDCDVLTIECASSDGQDLPLFKHIKTDKKIAIGVVNHCNTVVEPAEHVASLIRKALEYIPQEQLVISADCGFGREGPSRRIAFYKCAALVEGTNIVRRELGLPKARVRAADPGSRGVKPPTPLLEYSSPFWTKPVRHKFKCPNYLQRSSQLYPGARPPIARCRMTPKSTSRRSNARDRYAKPSFGREGTSWRKGRRY
jgi:hypothetical protein